MKKPARLLQLQVIALICLSLSVACNRASSKGGAGNSRVTVSETEAAKLAGQWKGTMKTKNHHDGTMELSLTRDGSELKAAAKFYNEKVSSASPIKSLQIKNAEISFITNILGANVHFTGAVAGDKLVGTLEAVQRNTTVDTGDWDLARRLQ